MPSSGGSLAGHGLEVATPERSEYLQHRTGVATWCPRAPLGHSKDGPPDDTLAIVACAQRDHSCKEAPPTEAGRRFLLGYVNSLLCIQQIPGGNIEKGNMVLPASATYSLGATPPRRSKEVDEELCDEAARGVDEAQHRRLLCCSRWLGRGLVWCC
jgi:hypothetical protein